MGVGTGIIKYTFADVAVSQTDSVLVAAIAGTSIKVMALIVKSVGASTSFVFNSKGSGAGTAISCTLFSGGPWVMPYCEVGWFQTNVGEGLTMTTLAGSTTAIQIVYSVRNI